MRRTVQVLSGQRWRAELHGLSPAINTTCLTAAPRICSVYSLVVWLRADVQHLKLRSLPMQKGCRKTHKRTLSTCHIPCFRLTAADISQLVCRTKTEQRQLMPSRLHVLSKVSVPFVVLRDFHNSDCLMLGAVQRLWYLYRDTQTPQTLPEVCLSFHP